VREHVAPWPRPRPAIRRDSLADMLEELLRIKR
jgi:hypothetical protein